MKLTNLELQAARNLEARRRLAEEGWMTTKKRGRPPLAAEAVVHGTEAAYKWEMRHNGEPCEICRLGRNRVERDRRRLVRQREGSVLLERRAEEYETRMGVR